MLLKKREVLNVICIYLAMLLFRHLFLLGDWGIVYGYLSEILYHFHRLEKLLLLSMTNKHVK